MRCGDDRDADVEKAATDAMAKLISANNPRCKKVFGGKQGNDCRGSLLVNLDDEIALRGAGGVQNMANSRKETTKAVPETQGKEVLQAPMLKPNRDSSTLVLNMGLQQTMTGTEAYLGQARQNGIAGTQRETAVAEET